MKSKRGNCISVLKRKYNSIPIQAKLALWIMLCTMLQKGISLICVPIFTRIMDTEEYGQVSAYFAWVNIAAIISSFKLNAGVYNKGLSKYKDDQKGYCLAMQYTTSLFTVVLLLLYIVLREPINKFTDLSTALTLLMFVELFFNTSMGFWTVRMQYEYKYRPIVFATLVLTILNPLLGVIMVTGTAPGEKGLARILSVIISQAIVGGFFYIVNLKEGKGKFKFAYAKFAVIFNVPLLPHYFSEYILNQSDRIMIQKMCSYSDVAFYSVAYNAGMLLTIITSSINQALTPWLYQSLDNKNYKDIKNNLLSLAAVITIPLLVLIAFAPEAIHLLAGEEYASAMYVIPPVAGSVIMLFLYTNFANIEFYYDYNKFTMYISVIGAVINIVLNYICIKMFGYVAAGYTTFASFMVYFVGHYLFMESIMKRHEGTHLILGKYVVFICVGLSLVSLLFSLIYAYWIIRYSIIILICIAVFLKRKTIMKTLSVLKKS